MTVKNLKRNLIKTIREYMLFHAERDKDNNIKCFITGKYFSEDNIHVCHYISRGKNKFSYDVRNNLRLCCVYTNTYEDGIITKHEDSAGRKLTLHKYKFRNGLIKDIGLDNVIEMENDNEIVKFYLPELKNLINKYKIKK